MNHATNWKKHCKIYASSEYAALLSTKINQVVCMKIYAENQGLIFNFIRMLKLTILWFLPDTTNASLGPTVWMFPMIILTFSTAVSQKNYFRTSQNNNKQFNRSAYKHERARLRAQTACEYYDHRVLCNHP